MDAVETLIPELRSLYGAIRIPRVANIDRPLNTLSVRTEQMRQKKQAAREGAACTLVRLFPRRPMSTDVCDALLGFCLGSGLGPRGKR